jgi:hypothetical protein
MEHSQKADKDKSTKASFGLGVVDGWNRLPDEAKSTDRLRVLKKEIKKTVWSRNVKGQRQEGWRSIESKTRMSQPHPKRTSVNLPTWRALDDTSSITHITYLAVTTIENSLLFLKLRGNISWLNRG